MNYDKEVSKVCGSLYSSLIEDTKEIEMFHYTNIESLISIFNTNSIWASNSLFLNDKEELISIKKNIDMYISKKKYTSAFLDFVNSKFDELSPSISERTYVVSFTKNRDSIPLWRIYAQKDGYNFGIGKQIFFETIHNDKTIALINKKGESQKVESLVFTGNVIYDDHEKEKQLSKYLDLLYLVFMKEDQINEDDYMKYYSMIFSDIILYAYLCKTPVFEIEEEYRLIVYLKNEEERQLFEQYRTRDGAIIPYIKIDICDKEMSFITQLNIGPCSNVEIRKESLKLFLDHIKVRNNYSIHASQIPYR